MQSDDMVAMGGGRELPLKEGEKSHQLLLAVLPWPESACGKVITEIKDEFPDLEFQYFHEQYSQNKEERGKLEVPEGN